MPSTHSKAEGKEEELGAAGELLPIVCGSGGLANGHGLDVSILFTDVMTGGRTVHGVRQGLEARQLPKNPQCSVKCGRKTGSKFQIYGLMVMGIRETTSPL